MWAGMLCGIIVEGTAMAIDSSKGHIARSFNFLHGASVDLPCTVFVASRDDRS